MPPVASTAAQAIVEGFTRTPRARVGRTQGCVFVARTLSTRVRAVRVLDNMCVLGPAFIEPSASRVRHFVFDRACGRACKWGIGYILVRGKLLKVETGALFACGRGNRFDENAHEGALKPPPFVATFSDLC